MCELFGISASRNVKLNTLLKEFYGRSNEHPNGWGLALLDNGNISIEREPNKAKTSRYLRNRLSEDIESSRAMAHIRRATVGNIDFSNTHPFTLTDKSGRNWVLIHNGTLFDSTLMSTYRFNTKGTTDSEWILNYLIYWMNIKIREKGSDLNESERTEVIDQIIHELAPSNKLNLIIYDGDNLYVHKNQEGTLHICEDDDMAIFSTAPLSFGTWKEFPQNELHVYRDGRLIAKGEKHEFTYIFNEEDYKYIFMDFANM